MEESAIYRHLPVVSARGTFLLAAVALLCLGTGLFAGSLLLVPAGLAGLAGLITGATRFIRVSRGRARSEEGKITLLAATFVSGTLAVYVAVAGYILLRFGE